MMNVRDRLKTRIQNNLNLIQATINLGDRITGNALLNIDIIETFLNITRDDTLLDMSTHNNITKE